MHDLDRAMFEMGAQEAESEAFEYEGEGGGQQELHELNESTRPPGETGELQELQEIQLASEFLEITNEAELDRFLGKLVGSATKALGTFARSDTGRALGGILKDAAKQALPVVGRAVGDYVAPGRGGEWGSRAGRAVGNLFGLELEGLSQEDREFEVARSFVRFADSACRKAATAPTGVPTPTIVRAAVTEAATQHAPGLLPALRVRSGSGNSGRWVRRGRSIVLFGL